MASYPASSPAASAASWPAVGQPDYVPRESFIGPLDGLGATPLAAWSVARRLTGSYSGPLIRIRESGGNTEADIGYDAKGNLNASAAAAHIGGGSGFIVSVYDQVGSNNLVQTTTSAQPAYLAAGVGSKPSADLNGTAHYWIAHALAASFTGEDKPITAHIAMKADVSNAVQDLVAVRNAASSVLYTILRHGSAANEWSFLRRGTASGALSAAAGGADTADHVATFWSSGTDANLDEDTTAILAAAALNADTMALDTFAVGASVHTSVTGHLNGRLAEVVLFAAALADTPRDALRDNMITFYGTA